MDNQAINKRLDALEEKLDLLLEYVNNQRLKNESLEDLGSDLKIVGKDIYNTAIEELDKRQVEIDPGEVTDLMISFLRNIPNFKVVMNAFEMGIDLMDELGPITNEAIIDFSKKLGELEDKGYFEFAGKMSEIADQLVSSFTPGDLETISRNIPVVANIIKNFMHPAVLKNLENISLAVKEMDKEEIPSYSMWGLMRQLNTPEMKKTMGMGVTLMKKITKE